MNFPSDLRQLLPTPKPGSIFPLPPPPADLPASLTESEKIDERMKQIDELVIEKYRGELEKNKEQKRGIVVALKNQKHKINHLRSLFADKDYTEYGLVRAEMQHKPDPDLHKVYYWYHTEDLDRQQSPKDYCKYLRRKMQGKH
jgi:hypothetical protein